MTAFDNKVMSEPATLNRDGLCVLEMRFRFPKKQQRQIYLGSSKVPYMIANYIAYIVQLDMIQSVLHDPKED